MQQGSATLTIDQIPLKRRSDLHLARKLWHVSGVAAMAAVHHFVSDDLALRLIAIAAMVFVTFDFARHQWPGLNRFALRFFGPFMREHERDQLAGTTYLLLGTLILLWFFPRPIVALTLIFLAVADPLASYVGIRYGKDKLIGPKSLQGSMAAFFACTLIASIYFLATGLMTERLLMVSLLCGLSGAVSELLPIKKLDDNLTFPVVNASLMWLIFSLFGGLT